MAKRKKLVPVKYTEDEYDYIQKEAERIGISKSEYIRRKVLRKPNNIIYTPEFRGCIESISEDITLLQENVEERSALNLIRQLYDPYL